MKVVVTLALDEGSKDKEACIRVETIVVIGRQTFRRERCQNTDDRRAGTYFTGQIWKIQTLNITKNTSIAKLVYLGEFVEQSQLEKSSDVPTQRDNSDVIPSAIGRERLDKLPGNSEDDSSMLSDAYLTVQEQHRVPLT